LIRKPEDQPHPASVISSREGRNTGHGKIKKKKESLVARVPWCAGLFFHQFGS
jgi:hypothetical protein